MNNSDIERRVETHFEAAITAMAFSFRDAAAQFAKRGSLQSSAHMLAKARSVGDALDKLATVVRDDVEAIENKGGNTSLFYGEAITKLTQLKLRGEAEIARTCEWAGGSASAAITAEVDRRYNAARRSLEDHKIGFGRSHATPSVHVQHSPGAAVQINSPNARATTNVNGAQIANALVAFEAALTAMDLEQSVEVDIRSDLDTIKAQLRKGTPSQMILRATGQSIRSVMDNLAAAAIQPHVWKLAERLFDALQ